MNVIGYTENGMVRAEIEGVEMVIPDDMGNRHRQMISEWEAEGNVIPEFSAVHSVATLSDYENAIQALIDGAARQRQFRDGVTLASYIGSTKPKWAAEAQTFVAWRDNVWSYAYAELAKVQSGQRQQPTVDQILEEIAPIAWPNT